MVVVQTTTPKTKPGLMLVPIDDRKVVMHGDL